MKRHTFSKSALALSIACLSGTALLPLSQANAHGYMIAPGSRAFLCNPGINNPPAEYINRVKARNTDCAVAPATDAPAPQSAGETNKGFPQARPAGPEDGSIASGGHAPYVRLDEAGVNRWARTPIKSGPNDFVWYMTAPHKTEKYEYYITKNNWNPNARLTRDAFEPTPFCTIDFGYGDTPFWTTSGPGVRVIPPRLTPVVHHCDVPKDHKGYHVILGAWEVSDTGNSFYNVNDVDIDSEGATAATSSQWREIGSLASSQELAKGDKVIVRLLDKSGAELTKQQIELTINDDNGSPQVWGEELAKLINGRGLGIRAGQIDGKDDVVASSVSNTMFADQYSALSQAILSYQIAPHNQPFSMAVDGVEVQYGLVGGKAQFNPKITVSSAAKGRVTLKNSDGYVVADAFPLLNAGSQVAALAASVPPGNYQLIISTQGYEADAKVTRQSFDVVVGNDAPAVNGSAPADATKANTGNAGLNYDYVFPEGLKSYKAGTRVLHNGKVYECAPFPYSGYCVQWSSSARGWEPGSSDAANQAWIPR